MGNQIYTVDMRNHGESPWDEDMTYEAMALDLARFVDEIVAVESPGVGGKIDLLGHSLGGKVAMGFALAHDELLNRLIVEDVSPKNYTTSSHALFPKIIETMVNANLESRSFANITEARRAMDDSLKETITDTPIRQFLLTNIRQEGNSYQWKTNLVAIAAHLDEIIDFTLPEEVQNAEYPGPTLFLSGSRSMYVRQDDHPLIKAMFPKVQFDVIAGAGHWVHADRPNDFIRSVIRFLAEEPLIVTSARDLSSI